MSEDWGPGFDGTPFEGMGNVNDAVYPAGAAALVENLPDMLQDSIVFGMQEVDGEVRTALLAYPRPGIAFLGLLVHNEQINTVRNLELVSFYPVLEGLPNGNLEIINFKPWKNGIEGMVAVGTKDFADLNFFDPLYFKDGLLFEKNTYATFALAALAFHLKVAENTEFTVSEGHIYEKALADFLKENPEKSERDFIPPTISLAMAHVLIPTPYTAEYQFRALVCGRQEIPFLDSRLLRYQLVFSNEAAEDAPELWLYAAPHCIHGREPLVGEFVEGIFWLTGYLPPRA